MRPTLWVLAFGVAVAALTLMSSAALLPGVDARARIAILSQSGTPMPTRHPLPATMRYVAAREPGPPEVLAIAEGPVPKPKAGEVLIEVSLRRRESPGLRAARRARIRRRADASPIIGLEVAGAIVALRRRRDRRGASATRCAR